ncbi:MAG: hypothetical protein MR473_07225 [Clostridiales bacterium]|nr:hypothetical protein [Clostridiales bacterium]
MKKQCTRKRWVLWACLAVAVLAVAAAAAYVISTIPSYPAFYKDVNSLEAIHRELKEMEDICAPEASWLGLTDGTYQLKMDGRFQDAEPEGYYIKGTIQCNDIGVSVSISGLPRARKTALNGVQYRDVTIEYEVCGERTENGVTSELANAEFDLYGYSYAIYTDYPVEALPEEEREAMRSALKDWAMEIAHQIIDTTCGKNVANRKDWGDGT